MGRTSWLLMLTIILVFLLLAEVAVRWGECVEDLIDSQCPGEEMEEEQYIEMSDASFIPIILVDEELEELIESVPGVEPEEGTVGDSNCSNYSNVVPDNCGGDAIPPDFSENTGAAADLDFGRGIDEQMGNPPNTDEFREWVN